MTIRTRSLSTTWTAGLRALAAASVGTAACAAPAAHPPPPESRVETVVDTLHGVAVPDPYRWLEDFHAAETRDWIARQNAYAEAVVGQSPLREAMEERLRWLMDGGEADFPRSAGDWEYFSLRRRGEELPVLYRRPAPEGKGTGAPVSKDAADGQAPGDAHGAYEVVLDPHGLSDENTTRFSIVTLSSDGRLMIYSRRDGGEDEVTLHVRDLEAGADLPDSLPRSLYGSVLFDPQGSGFHYVRRSRDVGPRLMHHELGTDVALDRTVFGEGYDARTFLDVSLAAEGRYLVHSVRHGWARSEVHLQDPRRSGAVTTIVEDGDARFYPRFVDGLLYMRTDLDADRNRLVAVDPASPGRNAWRDVIPEADEVMDDFSVVHGRLYVTYLADASYRIRVFEKDGTPAGEIDVPPFHSASIRAAGEGEAFLTLSSFLAPSTVYRLDLETGERTVWDPPGVEWDARDVVVRQVWRTSRDGTRAPMFLVHRRDVALDGDNPTLLTGYGGFYNARTPGFSPTAALWVEMGGVYAVATLRGGSEYGESWHRDGMLERKQNVFDDFVSAAEWLVEHGYTRPERLGITGASNGGLLVAAAVVQRPELFRAVLCGFPDVDILRFPFYTEHHNAPALLEYGDSRIPEQFEAIRHYSPYQNVQDGVAYPAVMFTTGDLDTRVPPQAARKMTARLQAATASGHPVILRYHPKAGHSAGRGLSFSRRVSDTAMELTFLARELGLEGAAPEPGS